MTAREENPDETQRPISRRAWFFVALWAAGVVAIYAAIGVVGVRTMGRYRAETQKLRQAWLTSPSERPGEKLPSLAPLPMATPVAVNVVINWMGGFDLHESTWEADFDIAFRWRGDGIDPGKTFRVVNGEILRKSQEVSYVQNGEHYELYNVRVRIEQVFDPSRIPLSDPGLAVLIEDPAHDLRSLRYQVNGAGLRVRPLLSNRSLKIIKTYAGVKYSTFHRAGENFPGPGSGVRSQFIFAMLGHISSREAYVKMFQALFASVGIALLAMFLSPQHADPRFELGVGAFFAAVGNNIFLATQLPPSGRATLTVFVNMAGLLTIFLTMVESTISVHMFHAKGERRLSLLFDRVSIGVFAIGYLTVNLLLPYAAMP